MKNLRKAVFAVLGLCLMSLAAQSYVDWLNKRFSISSVPDKGQLSAIFWADNTICLSIDRQAYCSRQNEVSLSFGPELSKHIYELEEVWHGKDQLQETSHIRIDKLGEKWVAPYVKKQVVRLYLD